jgi:L-fuculose-phosphate aldolase
MDRQTAYRELNDFGSVCVARGLVVGRAGNISVRLDDGQILISRRRSRLERLTTADLVCCSLESGAYQGDVRPSSETPFHRAIYQAQPVAQAILHSSAFYTTLIACSDIELRVDLFPESMAYLRNIGRVPYLHPGTEELAQAVAEQAEHRVIILGNHGLVVWGESVEETVQVSEMMERLCRMTVIAKLGAGVFALDYLGPDTQREFEERVLYGRG